jgi:hypothetical protein
VKTPVWEQAADDTRAAFGRLVARLGPRVVEVELPAMFEDAVGWHRTSNLTGC